MEGRAGSHRSAPPSTFTYVYGPPHLLAHALRMIGVLQPNLRRRPRYNLIFNGSTQAAAPVVDGGWERFCLVRVGAEELCRAVEGGGG